MTLDNNMISVEGLEVCQNIQDVCHNLTKLRATQDDLLKSTTYVAYELDKNHHNHANYESTISFDEIADTFAQQDDYGVRQDHPTKRKLSTIASRCTIKNQDIPLCDKIIPNITDIPEGIINVCELPNATRKREKMNDVVDEKKHDSKTNSKMNCATIIKILNDTILHGLPMTSTSDHTLQYNSQHNVKTITSK